MSTLLDAGLLFLLRFALDDNVEGVMSAAAHALKALLVCAEDEVSLCNSVQSASQCGALVKVHRRNIKVTVWHKLCH